MNPQDLQPASFRGVPFFVSTDKTDGGRRTVKKQFPNSDLQSMEDLGLLPRTIHVSGCVAAQRDASGAEIRSYKELRDALLAAFEKPGPGVLVHPFYGRMENMQLTSYSLEQSISKLGDAGLDATFEVSNADGRPQPTESVIGSVTSGVEAVDASTVADIADRFGVTQAFTGNFTDAVGKVQSVAAALTGASQTAAVAQDELDGYSSAVAAFDTGAVGLVNSPSQLGASTVSLIGSVSALYAEQQDVFGAMVGLFGFGDLDVPILLTTAGRIEKDRNRKSLNSGVQVTALSQAYLSAAKQDYATTQDIDETSATLEAQYQKLVLGGQMGRGQAEELAKLRVTSNRFFDQQRDIRPSVIDVRTEQTSTRLLAYQYYGSSELGPTLAELNDVDDPAVIEGDVKVLTA